MLKFCHLEVLFLKTVINVIFQELERFFQRCFIFFNILFFNLIQELLFLV